MGSRIIPALAGNTRPPWIPEISAPDHPRAGGEHRKGGVAAQLAAGSSPRWRGTRRPIPPHLTRHRIIPALAGNTHASPPKSQSNTDHPRAGGEHHLSSSGSDLNGGSSPRWRGTRSGFQHIIFCRRIIPALAGNTRCQALSTRFYPDHPRAGGEHTTTTPDIPYDGGSSPRWRGTLTGPDGQVLPQRIIPALAGNTSPDLYDATVLADHPRAGGEHPRRVVAED